MKNPHVKERLLTHLLITMMSGFLVPVRNVGKVLAMLRRGSAALRIETGRWNGLEREGRICRQCTMGEIGDEAHFC